MANIVEALLHNRLDNLDSLELLGVEVTSSTLIPTFYFLIPNPYSFPRAHARIPYRDVQMGGSEIRRFRRSRVIGVGDIRRAIPRSFDSDVSTIQKHLNLI